MDLEIRVAGIIKESIVDGPGIRYVVFAQGCKRHCPGCHNPQTHSFSGGSLVKIDEIIGQVKRNPLLDGVTFSGGEPFEQAEGFAELARRVHDMKLNVIVYTGYTYEELINGADVNPGWKELLDAADILVDGPYIEEEKDYMLRFRGSRNQRIIDLRKTRLAGTVILAEI